MFLEDYSAGVSNLGDGGFYVTELVGDVAGGDHWYSSKLGELCQSLGVVHHCRVFDEVFAQNCLDIALHEDSIGHGASLE